MAELDATNDSPAYLCGRLFAILEAIQYVALGDISATITERYYGTASSAPASVFGRLLRGAQPHLAKMRGDKSKQGAAIRFDRDLQEILAGFEAYGKRFPSTLTMIEQGIFAIGYYNQRAFDRRAARAAAERKAAKQLVGTSFINREPAGEEEAPIADIDEISTQGEIQ